MLLCGGGREDRELREGGIYLRMERRRAGGFLEEGTPKPDPSKSAGIFGAEVGREGMVI